MWMNIFLVCLCGLFIFNVVEFYLFFLWTSGKNDDTVFYEPETGEASDVVWTDMAATAVQEEEETFPVIRRRSRSVGSMPIFIRKPEISIASSQRYFYSSYLFSLSHCYENFAIFFFLVRFLRNPEYHQLALQRLILVELLMIQIKTLLMV